MTRFDESRYHRLDVLGEGAMGVVWRAHDTTLDRYVAVKHLRAGLRNGWSDLRAQFLTEARAAARLTHPNIVGVHDVFSDGGDVVLVMELVEGPTLAQRIGEVGAQPVVTVRAVMSQVAQALACAHAAGVVHRDLKAENVFLTAAGRAVVGDFGVARIGSAGPMDGAIVGTPGVMAPEQIRGRLVGPPADVFAWGALAYELVTGRPPFGDPSRTDPDRVVQRTLYEEVPPLTVPEDRPLAALIERTLAKDPTRRPPDGMALVEALGTGPSLAATPPPRPASAPAPPYAAEPRSSGSPLVWIGVVGVVGVLALLLTVALAVGRDDGEKAGSTTVITTPTSAPTSPTTTNSTTTTMSPPAPIPAQKVALPAALYQTSALQPPIRFRVGASWSVFAVERDPTVGLALDGTEGKSVLYFARVDAVYDRSRTFGPGDHRLPGARVTPPNDLLDYLDGSSNLAVVDRRNEVIGGRSAVSGEVEVTPGYRYPGCTSLCVLLFPDGDDQAFYFDASNRNRMFVLTVAGGKTMVATVEAPPDQYERALAAARGVLATVELP